MLALPVKLGVTRVAGGAQNCKQTTELDFWQFWQQCCQGLVGAFTRIQTSLFQGPVKGRTGSGRSWQMIKLSWHVAPDAYPCWLRYHNEAADALGQGVLRAHMCA